ncbi:MAG TPA: thioesterase domain-containing protein [Blastocatellia bacterium]|nr:thioesterase domain-containing protein [Blastocatellia bacterium]
MKEIIDPAYTDEVKGEAASQSREAALSAPAGAANDSAKNADHSELRKNVFELLADEEGIFESSLAELLAEDSFDSGPASLLIPIRAAGSKPPLFCIHPAGGQVMVYHHLSNALGSDQPFYGLQSRALDDSSLEHGSIEEMAAEYADAIRQQQAEGPYHLMGWSMGGVIAVNIAHHLERQGQQVAFVGLIDSFLFDDASGEEDPLADLALAFGGVLADAFDSLDAQSQQAIQGELLSLSPEQRVIRVMQWARERGLLPADLSPEIFQEQVKLSAIHTRLLRGHRAPTINAPLKVWWAEGNQAPRTDWGKHTLGEFSARALTGNHFTLLYPPYCEALARGIEESLEAAHRSSL